MKLTIAIDDISIPLPPMVTPDIRQRILEHVIELAARNGVEDVELIVATALHRRMTPSEIERMVGERVFRSFFPKQLYNFDAEDPEALTSFGTTDEGEDVEISKRAAESDLIVYVNINLVAMDGGHKSVAVGLASYKSLKHHHNVETMLHSRSYMDPREGHSAINDSVNRMGRKLAADGVKVFQIETTLNSRDVPGQPRLPEQARVGVERVRPGADAGREEGERGRAPARAPRALPADRGALQSSRASTPARWRRCTSARSRTCIASSWWRSRASPTF